MHTFHGENTMLLNSKRLRFAFAGLVCLLVSQISYAVIVTPGSSASLNGTTFVANPDLGGLVIRDQLIPFQIKNTLGNVILSGNVQDRVVRSNNTGNLIFAPRLRDLSNPTGGWIIGFSMSGFNGYSTDVDYRTDGMGTIGPNNVARDIFGDSLTYRYDPSFILPPDEGRFLSVSTDATAFDLSGRFVILAQDDFGASIFRTTLTNVSAPSAVPVPAALWLFGSGLLGLLGLSRRKK